jgi:hypothetical protein
LILETKLRGLTATPRWIVICTGAYFLVDLFALYFWTATGQTFSLQSPSESASGLSVTAMAAMGLYLTVVVLGGFRRGAPLRPAWRLIALTFAMQAMAGILAQLRSNRLQQLAQFADGPIRLTLLAIAIHVALRIMRKFGFWVRPTASDWAVSAVVCLFAICRLEEILAGGQINFADCKSLADLPVLCVVVFEVVLLRRSLLRMGKGPIAKCWAALVHGILLTTAVEMTLWIIPHFSPEWPPAVIGSLTKFPIAAILALAPAYQLRAQRQANEPDTGSPTELATHLPALAP